MPFPRKYPSLPPVDGVPVKHCVKCGEVRPYAEFHKWAGSRDGLKTCCKTCRKPKVPKVRKCFRKHPSLPPLDGVPVKRCNDCGDVKPRTEFYRRARACDGLASSCKGCVYGKGSAKRRLVTPEVRLLKGRVSCLKFKYGITPEDYQEMLAAQGGVCAVCGAGPGVRALAVDHCHTTGRVRGILCPNCNTGLGKFRDDVGLLTRAITYLVER